MFVRRFMLPALLLGAALPLPAQSAAPGEARDFWTGFGRYNSAALEKAVAFKREIPDLSGAYEVNGAGSDPTKTYNTTLDVSRSKTLTTPEGAKINVYKLTWNWSDRKVTGIGVLLGSRLYVGYGSPVLGLYLVAPLVLSSDELQRYNEYWDFYEKEYKKRGIAEARNGVYGFKVKNAPFFVELTSKREPRPDPAYYALWVTPNPGYGSNILRSMPEWKEGRYFVPGTFLNDDGDPSDKVLFSVSWYVGRMGVNYRVLEVPNTSPRAEAGDLVAHGKDEIDGTAFVLEDGTVLMLMGGNDKCGVGYYEVKDKKLVGVWAEQFAVDRGTETLTPSADVLAKNPKFFGQ